MEYYGSNNEDFPEVSPEDIVTRKIAEGGYGPGDMITVYGQEFQKTDASDFLPPLFEHMTEAAYDELGDCGLDWGYTKEEAAELQKRVGEFVDSLCKEKDWSPRLLRPVGESFEIEYRVLNYRGEFERVGSEVVG